MSATPVVRRCRGCGEAAVLPGLLVRNSSMEIHNVLHTQVSRCQRCGRRVPLCSRPITIGIFVAGLLLAPILLGLPLLVIGWWLHKQDAWNPVVPGAAAPPERYRTGPRPRTCGACGGACIAQGKKRQLVGVLPAGATVVFACAGCGARFGVENLFGLSISLFGGLMGLALAPIAATGAYVGAPLFAAAILLVGGLFGLWMVFAGLRVRWRNPVRADALLD